jgi:hypothetical protein
VPQQTMMVYKNIKVKLKKLINAQTSKRARPQIIVI